MRLAILMSTCIITVALGGVVNMIETGSYPFWGLKAAFLVVLVLVLVMLAASCRVSSRALRAAGTPSPPCRSEPGPVD